MEKSLYRFTCLIVCALLLPSLGAAAELSDTLKRAHPTIKWDQASQMNVDFNGDRIPDSAILGYQKKHIFVAVSLGGAQHAKSQLLKFGVDTGEQDSLCVLPAKLIIEPLSCVTDGSPLPGCKQGAGAKALALSDDRCDAIHLYWDHKARQMGWWRN